MDEKEGDIFEDYMEPDVMYVVPTNGFVKKDQLAVMGKGLALDAKLLQKGVDRILGDYLLSYGNHCYLLPGNLVSFPTKTHWKNKSELDLIERSLVELRHLWDFYGRSRRIYLPRVGCGNGGLSWYHVKPLVERQIGDLPVTIWSY